MALSSIVPAQRLSRTAAALRAIAAQAEPLALFRLLQRARLRLEVSSKPTVAGRFHQGSVSDMTGATASANGAHGLVIQPNAGQQNLFLRGDATWADPGAVLSHFSFRDANLSGFTGARWEMYQLAGSSNNTTGSVSAATFPIANNEIILIRLDWIMAPSDLSKAAAGSLSKAFKKVGSTISTLSTGTPTSDTMKDGSQAVFMSITNLTASTVDLVVLSDSYSQHLQLVCQRSRHAHADEHLIYLIQQIYATRSRSQTGFFIGRWALWLLVILNAVSM